MRFMLFALAAAAVAVPANAKEIQNVRSLDIAVSGAIRQHCAMGSAIARRIGRHAIQQWDGDTAERIYQLP